MHHERLAHISGSLDVLEKHKPKWYHHEEKKLASYDRSVSKKALLAMRHKPPDRLPMDDPPGIRAAERGR